MALVLLPMECLLMMSLAEDMKFAIEQDVDMIFASFIRSPNDVKLIRAVCFDVVLAQNDVS